MYRDELTAAHLRIQQLEQKMKTMVIKPKEKKVKEKKSKEYWWGDWTANSDSIPFIGLLGAVSILLSPAIFLERESADIVKETRNEMGRIVCKNNQYVLNEHSPIPNRRDYKCLVNNSEYKIIVGVDPYKR